MTKNQKNGFPINLYKKAKELGLDSKDPATLETVIKAIPQQEIGKIDKEYIEKLFFMKACNEKGLTLADLVLTNGNKQDKFITKLSAEAAILKLDPKAPESLGIAMREIGIHSGKINEEYIKQLVPDLPDLMEKFKKASDIKQDILNKQKEKKALQEELKAKGETVPPELTDTREIKEKLAKKLQDEPYNLRKDVLQKGL